MPNSKKQAGGLSQLAHDTEGYMAKRLHQLRDLLEQRGLRRERLGREMAWRLKRFPGFVWSLGWEAEP